MNQDRGLNAIIGVVFAFSLLWTLAVLIPDSDEVVQLRENRFQLIVNGTHYVFDSDALPDDTVVREHVKVVHYISPSHQRNLRNSIKSSTSRSKQESRISQPVKSDQIPKTLSSSSSASSTSSTKEDVSTSNLFPTYIWFAIFILYHARNFTRKRTRMSYDEDFFAKSGLDARLEYDDDFYSVDHSFYGTMSHWSGDDCDKFDVDNDDDWDSGDLSLEVFDEKTGTLKFYSV